MFATEHKHTSQGINKTSYQKCDAIRKRWHEETDIVRIEKKKRVDSVFGIKEKWK